MTNNTQTAAGFHRRALLAGLAVAPAAALASVTAPAAASLGVLASSDVDDPIFAAIERHRAAWAAYDATLDQDHLESYIPAEQRRSCLLPALRGDPDWRIPTDHPDWIAYLELSVAAWSEEAEAACLLVSTEGLTPVGAIALLNYAKERSHDPQFWQDLEQDGETVTWHYLMFSQVTEALAVMA